MKLAVATLVLTSVIFSGHALAQSPQVQPSKRSPQAQAAQPPASGIVAPGSVGGWAVRAIAMVDAGQLAQLWDGASSVAKKQVKREDFIGAVQAARKPLGAVAGREWSVVRRQRNPGSEGVPAGEYASVETVVLFAGKQFRTELVTFRHDEDGIWRFAGYVLR